MRLLGQAKAGFYPTPPKTLQGLVEALGEAEELREKAALDPCAGEGEALFRVAEALSMRPYAVELDLERARRAKERLAPLGGRVVQGDAFNWIASGFALLWLNPPYDWAGDGTGERLEERFLKAYWDALSPGGLLVLLVPEGELERLFRFLGPEAAHAAAFRFHEEEYPRFRQVAVLAAKKRFPWESARTPRILPFREGLKAVGEVLRHVHPPKEEPVLRERPKGLEGLLAEARRSPLWERVEGLSVREAAGFRPLLPLRQAHLALLIAGGLMDLQEVEIEGERHAVLGRLRKEVVEIEEETEGGLKRVEREVFRVGLTLLSLRTGEVKEVEG